MSDSLTPSGCLRPVDYYYSDRTRQLGPVSEVELRRLAAGQVVQADTLVWREGMAEWARLADVLPDALPTRTVAQTEAPASSTHALVCSHCRRPFPIEEIVQVAGQPICAECKPAYLQRLREGESGAPQAEELRQVMRVARAQKGVIWCILAGIAVYVLLLAAGSGGSNALFVAAVAGVLVVVIAQAVFVYRLAAALGSPVAILWVLGVIFCSWIGLLLMLILSIRATKVIRNAGFQVGVMGADLRAIEAALQ